jgi:hypothetical protein
MGLEEWAVVPFVTDLEGINSGIETVNGEGLEDWQICRSIFVACQLDAL